MTKKQRNLVAMYRTVLSHMDANPALWQQAVPIADAVGLLRAHIEAIETQSQVKAESETAGYTRAKNVQRERVVDLAFDLVRRMRPYARIQQDEVLSAAINYSPSELMQVTQEETIDRCETIHAQATAHLANLGLYGVTQEMLDELGTAIETFKPMIALRDTVRSTRAAATAALPGLFDQAREQAILLDDLVPALIEDADFTATYEQARTIIDL